MNKHLKITLYLILGIYLLISIVFWLYSDAISEWAATGNPFLVTLVNLLLNPFYIGTVILLIELFFIGFKLNRNLMNYLRIIFASVLLSLAIDIFTISHTVLKNYVMPSTPQLSLYFDTILGKFLFPLLGRFKVIGTFILYVLIPFIMMLLALLIASPKHFIGLLKKEVGLQR